jgi:hypothetical protein
MVKTVLEEPKTTVSTRAVPRVTKPREARVNGVQTQQQPNVAAAVPSEADGYESCLDLSALFLPRG